MESEACEEPNAPGLPRAPAALRRGNRPWREARDAGPVFAAPTGYGCHTALPPLSVGPNEQSLTGRGRRADVMPPFWWNVKKLTVLQYTIHEFQVFGPRELLQIDVVKIYLHRKLLA